MAYRGGSLLVGDELTVAFGIFGASGANGPYKLQIP